MLPLFESFRENNTIRKVYASTQTRCMTDDCTEGKRALPYGRALFPSVRIHLLIILNKYFDKKQVVSTNLSMILVKWLNIHKIYDMLNLQQ